ncbi:MAG: restriction endonuclease subunit R [Pseudanabaenales cyanobacterium]|nr:restriction endonuclease subunit R [Pseudanabaenales cyanobacterium]
MVQTLSAQKVTLFDLSQTFGLERTIDAKFFPEWQETLPELSDFEKQMLDEVKGDYLHLSKYPLLEPIVKMVVLAPLLKLAGFYRAPFYVTAEKEVTLTSEDEDTVIQGKVDLLVFHPDFWITLIEAKRAAYSLEAAMPQALAYMLSASVAETPSFGLVTNGGEFRFIKLVRSPTPQYALSDLFSLDSRDDIDTILEILKHLGQLVSQS